MMVQAERAAAERQEEERFRQQALEKLAEEDRIEQMNAQRRRLKMAEHKREVERLLAEKRAIFEAALVRPYCKQNVSDPAMALSECSILCSPEPLHVFCPCWISLLLDFVVPPSSCSLHSSSLSEKGTSDPAVLALEQQVAMLQMCKSRTSIPKLPKRCKINVSR